MKIDTPKDLGNEEAYFKSEEELPNIKEEVLKIEVGKVMPFNELQITERTQTLQDVLKQVEVVLTKNANKHSTVFVAGMDLVDGVKIDLEMAKEITQTTRSTFDQMKVGISCRSTKIMMLARRKQRIVAMRKIMVDVLNRFKNYKLKL